MAETATPQDFNLREYWQILVRRRWMIYTLALVTTVVSTVASFVATPTYKSTTTIAIERSGVRLLKQDLGSAEPSWLDYQNFYNTQYKIIESERVLRTAVETLKLRTTGLPGQQRSVLDSILELKDRLIGSLVGSGRPATDPWYPYVQFLHGGLSVEPVRDSHLVHISFISTDRDFAARAANAIARAYIEFTLGSKLEIARDSGDFFVKRIAELRGEIAREDDALQVFARQNQLVTGDANEAALKNFEELRAHLTKAQAELAEAKGKYEAYAAAPPDSLDEVRKSALIEQLATSAAAADAEYRQKQATYGALYPEVIKARSKYETTRDKLVAETQAMARQTIQAARVDYQNKQNQVSELQRLFDGSRTMVDRFQGPYSEYLTRRKIIDAKRATLNDLLDKENQMALSASLGDTGHNVRVIDEAQPSRSTFRPKKKLNITLGLLFGLFLGVGAAVLMEYVDNTLKTPDDVRNVLGLPVLGMIPLQEAAMHEPAGDGARARRWIARARRTPDSGDGAEPEIDPALITMLAPLSPTAEAYRELRTAILLATAGHPPRDLTVTSCQPGEGKTTTAINIAIALAQLGRRVLLVDTDMRRPRCHRILRTSSARGVSTFLTGNSDLFPLVQPTGIEGVHLLPGGPIPPNPAELLDADRFRDMVAMLRASEDYDHVVFDSPPVLSVVDPLLIGRHTEGTVIVLKSAFTSRESGRLGKEKLLSGRVNLLGVLLNAVSSEHVPAQYRYYREGYARREADPRDTTDRDHEAGVGGGRHA